MEVKVSHLNFGLDCYLLAVKYLESEKPKESLVVFFGNRRLDYFKPGWYWYQIKAVLKPQESDYANRTSSFIRMRPEFHEKIKGFAQRSGLEPLVFDHCQPIDVLSGQDIHTAERVSGYYSGSITGSYNRFHRFFRVAGKAMEMISWAVEDETHHRQKLAIGEENQRGLASAKVLIAGVGGVGWKISVDLALMGVGQIDLVDPDRVEESNLSRISLPKSSVGKFKAEQLKALLETIRPGIVCNSYPIRIQDFEPSRFKQYDVAIVATDNAQSRLHCNDICLKHRIRSIQIGASLENGMNAISCRTVVPGFTPCYECWKKFSPEELQRDYYTEEQKRKIMEWSYGLPGPVPSIVNMNSIAAGIAEEAFLRLIANGKIVPYLYLDLKELTLRTYSKQRDPNCHACSNIRDYDVELTGSELFDDQSEEDKQT
jgi:molybdopterin/thiamine biosynthesis adenylyltransferase